MNNVPTLEVGTEITVNFIWIECDNEWQIPEDWDPHLFDKPVSENLNEVAEHWYDGENLEFIAKKFVSPPEFLNNPEFDTLNLSQILGDWNLSQILEGWRDSDAITLNLLPNEWIELGKSLKSIDIEPCVIAVPHDMTPWAWYNLTEDEKLFEMGLSHSDGLRADGIFFSYFNSFYFDSYKFGTFSFNLMEDMELEEIVVDPRFVKYAQEIIKRGPDSLFHVDIQALDAANFDSLTKYRTYDCSDDTCRRNCSRFLHFPASITVIKG